VQQTKLTIKIENEKFYSDKEPVVIPAMNSPQIQLLAQRKNLLTTYIVGITETSGGFIRETGGTFPRTRG